MGFCLGQPVEMQRGEAEQSKTTDLGEKLDLLDVVFGLSEPSQPAVIAGKGSVFGGWRGGWLCPSAWNHFDHTFQVLCCRCEEEFFFGSF